MLQFKAAEEPAHSSAQYRHSLFVCRLPRGSEGQQQQPAPRCGPACRTKCCKIFSRAGYESQRTSLNMVCSRESPQRRSRVGAEWSSPEQSRRRRVWSGTQTVDDGQRIPLQLPVLLALVRRIPATQRISPGVPALNGMVVSS